MTWGFPAQRRADEFDALVEGTSTGESHARDAHLLELVGALRGVPTIEARPEFVADLRMRLMAEVDSAHVPADLARLTLPARRTRRERRLAAVVGGLAVVGATTSIAVASQSALPGDSLYPVKRAIESAHTGLSVGEGSKGATVLASASDRLDEVDALTREDGLGDEARVSETLTAFAEQASEASDLLIDDYTHTGDESSIARLRDFASSSLGQLAALEPRLPADARDELLRAADVLSTIDIEAGQRCATCGGTPIDSIPPALAGPAITVPRTPVVTQADRTEQHRGDAKGDRTADSGPRLPDLGGGALGPGSVLDPGSALEPQTSDITTGVRESDGPRSGDQQSDGSDPVRDLANGLTGGGGGTPTRSPTLPAVGDVVDDVGEILQGVVDPLTRQAP